VSFLVQRDAVNKRSKLSIRAMSFLLTDTKCAQQST